MRDKASASTRPFALFEWVLASRYLRARRKEGFIAVIAGFSILGITLGVATLIVVLSVMNGLRKELLDKIVGINGHIFVSAIDKPLTDYAELIDRFSKLVGVRMVLPFVEGEAFASSPFAGSGALVRGVREQDLKKVRSVADNVKEGTLEGFDEKNGVAIGKRLAEALGLHAGDYLKLTSPNGAVTPFGTSVRSQSYPILAVFEIGMSDFDARFVYLPLTEALAFFGRSDVTVIEIYLDNPDRTDQARRAIESVANRPLALTDWRVRNRTFFDALEVERNVMFLILLLIVLVAALNIVSGLIMLVKDKSDDIAVLRTMGASRGAIMRVFLITGASIGIIGTLAGFVLGLVIASNVEAIRQALSRLTSTDLFPREIYFLSQLPAVIDPSEVTTVVLTALILSLLATLYPSWRAARLDPVEALRYG